MKHKERMRMVGETGISLSTVIKWEKGGKVTDANDRALARAAEKLNLENPSEVQVTNKAAQ